MGTGIGKDCLRCGNQLNYDEGFTWNEKFCTKCEKRIKFDALSPEEKMNLLDPNYYKED